MTRLTNGATWKRFELSTESLRYRRSNQICWENLTFKSQVSSTELGPGLGLARSQPDEGESRRLLQCRLDLNATRQSGSCQRRVDFKDTVVEFGGKLLDIDARRESHSTSGVLRFR